MPSNWRHSSNKFSATVSFIVSRALLNTRGLEDAFLKRTCMQQLVQRDRTNSTVTRVFTDTTTTITTKIGKRLILSNRRVTNKRISHGRVAIF